MEEGWLGGALSQMHLLRKFNSVSGCICNLSAFVKFHRKLTLFMVYIKRLKKLSCEIPYFQHQFFSFLHTRHDTLICRETTLWTCSTWRCTFGFLFRFFYIKKFVKYIFQNKESISPRSQNTTPFLLLLYNRSYCWLIYRPKPGADTTGANSADDDLF
jgi:hypothetical protein